MKTVENKHQRWSGRIYEEEIQTTYYCENLEEVEQVEGFIQNTEETKKYFTDPIFKDCKWAYIKNGKAIQFEDKLIGNDKYDNKIILEVK